MDTNEIPDQPEAGALPLKSPKEEHYARARSLNYSPNEAGQLAGYAVEWRNTPKVERRAHVQARIAWLIRQPEEVLKVKREEIEGFLWRVHRRKISEFYEKVEEPVLTKEGAPTGEMRHYQRMRLFEDLSPEQQQVVEGLKYTEAGPALSLYSQMQANIELRKLLGIGATSKGEDDTGSLTEEQLMARIVEGLRAMGLAIGASMAANKAA